MQASYDFKLNLTLTEQFITNFRYKASSYLKISTY